MAPVKVTVALSGGADSSVAAYLLKEKGYDVSAVTMRLHRSAEEQIELAKEICALLGIRHSVIDLVSRFEKGVIQPFCTSYRLGLTPNPCVWCNHKIKFGALLTAAQDTGSSFLATGHYARIESENGFYRLIKGDDRQKDQSYFLYRLDQTRLSCVLFPVGKLYKSNVVRLARNLGLPVPAQSSQDICFIQGNDYRLFLREKIPPAPGVIVDTVGNPLGTHSGVFNFTVGQRKGLGLGGGGKTYVINLDPKGTVTVGSRQDLERNNFCVRELSWVSGRFPYRDDITARIRYQAHDIRVKLSNGGRWAKVQTDRPQYAITPGQSVAFYAGDEILGGGIISS